MSKAFDLSQVVRGHGITADISGYRNKIINGGFQIAQRGVASLNFGPSAIAGYGLDRWRVAVDGGQIITCARANYIGPNPPLPPETRYGIRLFCSTPASGQFPILSQRIEGVQTLSGKKATLTFYAASPSGAVEMRAVALRQHFGSGGAAAITDYKFNDDFDLNLGTGVRKFQFVFDVPGIGGKALGSGDFLEVLFYLPVGTNFDIYLNRVSLVEGDATAETDPFSPRHIQQELALCQRYYQRVQANVRFISTASGQYAHGSLNWPEMRVTPTAAVIDTGSVSNTGVINLDNPNAYGGRITITSAAAGDSFVIGRTYALDGEL